MSEANKPVATNQTCKQGSKVVVHDRGMQCYFRPETEEFVFISPCEATAFENHWRGMMLSMDAFHEANANYSGALEFYAKEATLALSQAEREDDLKGVDYAEQELEKQRAALKKMLGDLSVKGVSYDDVVELIPVLGQGTKSKGGIKPTRYAYVRKAYFSEIEKGLKLHLVSLKGSDQKGGAKSIYNTDKNGKVRIDMQKLTKQLTDLRQSKAKLDLQKVMKWMGSDFDLDALNKNDALFDWAESWTHSLKGEADEKGNVDVTGGAQFMRFVSNVGVNAEFDPNKGQLAFKGESKSSLALASGFVKREFYAPDRIGWKLAMQLDDGQEINLGMLRLRGEVELSGFAGASLQLEAQVQVLTNGKEQAFVGQSGRLPRMRERKDAGIKFYKAMDAKDEGLHLGGEVFAGARLEGSIKGSLQWLKPNPPPDPAKPLPPILQSTGEYTDFCTIGSNIAGLLGAGAGGKFYCTFLNGKFCFHVASSLCWGAGAKGGFIAEVDAATIVEFGAWLVYQLYSLDYSFFEVIDRDAFKGYSQYCVMQMAAIERNVYGGINWVVKTPRDIADDLEKFVESIMDEGKNNMEASKGRNFLARSVIDFKEDLLLHTPEAKGILLYLLTRHGKFDHIDLENRTLLGDIYRDRKDAVIWVLTSIQTVSEWRKVMCHMTVDGSSLVGATPAAEVVREQEAHLVRFLQEGYNRDEGLKKAEQELMLVYNRLKKTSAIGYALAMNNTSYYKFNSGPNYNYPQRCVFGPCASASSEYA